MARRPVNAREPERTFLSFDQLSRGAGHAPSRHDHNVRDLIRNDHGMVTICPHGWILREGWPSLNATGQALVDLVRNLTASADRPHGRHTYRSSLPVHCADCAHPTDVQEAAA
jgi:hypothetical protein